MKRLLSAALAALLLFSLAPLASANEALDVTAQAAVLMERDTGRVLYEKNPHEKLPPASVTKVMGLLLIVEAIDEGRIALTDTVTTSDHASSMGGSQIFLSPGEKMSVEDMLKSVVVSSANDAIVALGEHIAGSEAAFVSAMNHRAIALGMNDTTFKNASGLDEPGHVTSAYDIALMSRELLLYPLIKEYTTIWMDSVRGGDFQLANTNKLIRSYPGATGLKTGYTSVAKYCLAGSAERDGMELVCGILGAPTSNDRFDAAKMLLDYGFANYTLVALYPPEALAPVDVMLGEAPFVQPVLSDDNKLLVDKSDAGRLVKEVVLQESVEAPVERGQKLGEMIVSVEETELSRIAILASDEVPRLTLPKLFSRFLRTLFMADG
ncbi:D-alanyl-D-alanine carboxypeptidase [Oscillospiraceae bacterium OttesenSCG-928-G22]|nr:D-alanyl-D-alanine carboxypeptidase [Oscillospiraceae bacterium OttesenSCG-928-G22]